MLLLHPDFFQRTAASTWRTDAGSIDILSELSTTSGAKLSFEDLRSRSTYTSGEQPMALASLDDIIESKRAAGRQKDRDALPELEDLRRNLDSGPET